MEELIIQKKFRMCSCWGEKSSAKQLHGELICWTFSGAVSLRGPQDMHSDKGTLRMNLELVNQYKVIGLVFSSWHYLSRDGHFNEIMPKPLLNHYLIFTRSVWPFFIDHSWCYHNLSTKERKSSWLISVSVKQTASLGKFVTSVQTKPKCLRQLTSTKAIKLRKRLLWQSWLQQFFSFHLCDCLVIALYILSQCLSS